VGDWAEILQAERFGLRLRPGAPDTQLTDAADRLGVRLPAGKQTFSGDALTSSRMRWPAI